MTVSPDRTHLKAIIVDDEIDACRNLHKALMENAGPGIQVLGMAQSTSDAETQIALHKPDVIFLDIEMPHENAFDFLERLAPVNFEVVFVTAYDDYAVKAFRLNAVDYILKPISVDEVVMAVGRTRSRLTAKRVTGGDDRAGNFYGDMKGRLKLDKIRLKDSVGFEMVDFKDVLYIEAKGSYSSVHFLAGSDNEKSIISSHSLNEYEELFPSDLFCRIHRSFLINCMHVKKVTADDNSFLVMKNKVKLPVSRRRVTELMEYFKKR